MDSTLERLAGYTTSVLAGELEPSWLASARQRFVDTVACALGGFGSPPATVARSIAVSAEHGGARIWGTLVRVTPEDAALMNGIAVRYLDYNDTYRSRDGSHPSDNISGLVALAEHQGSTGAVLTKAIVASYEVQSRFADHVPFNKLGWDQPTAGVIAAAVGGSVILGLDEASAAHAISLAITPNMAMHQTRSGELSWWKGCAGAMGSRQGILAARLAAAGMEGPEQPFDGVNGLWAQIGERFEVDGLGTGTAAIGQSNLKTWPVRDSCQLPIDTALLLRAELGAERPVGLRIETYASAYRGAVADRELWHPRTRETADHSMLVAVTVALLDGEVSPSTFDRGRFKDDDVLSLIGATAVDVNAEFDAAAPAVRTCRITATLASGREVTATHTLTQADIEAGRPEQETTEKLRRLAKGVMDHDLQEDFLQRIWKVDEADSVVDLVSTFRYGSTELGGTK